MTIVGTVKAGSKGLPKDIVKGGEEKFSSNFFYNASNSCTFVNYQCKRHKNVILISTMHYSPFTDATEKKKLAIVHFYNQSKVGVNVVDQMARQYTTHAATQRWPLAVWKNILDIAAINFWILYKKCTQCTISRRNFMLQLVEYLRDAYVTKRMPFHWNDNKYEDRPFGKRRKCDGSSCQNKTVTICRHCRKPTCGKCRNGGWKLTECTS